MTLTERILKGDIRAAARLIRNIDDGDSGVIDELKRLFPHTGKAFVVGITGPPGAGKSTLTDKLIETYRGKGKTVAVIAIDPTSPFSGGALLGDRIRMNRHATDEGVFIRSLGTRGHLGGLSKSTNDIISVFDAMGWDLIIVETVGVGQDEVDIASTAHTTLVVSVPGLGDDIQAIKAGILEIGDIFVINKADRPEADLAAKALTTMIEMNHPGEGEWWPPIVKTVALTHVGMEELVEKIEEHRSYLTESGNIFRTEKKKHKIYFEELLKDELFKEISLRLSRSKTFEKSIDAISQRKTDPHTEVEKILRIFIRQTQT